MTGVFTSFYGVLEFNLFHQLELGLYSCCELQVRQSD